MQICNDITLKHGCYQEIFGVTIDNKLSFDEHIINICKTANKTLAQGNIFLKTLLQHLVNEA